MFSGVLLAIGLTAFCASHGTSSPTLSFSIRLLAYSFPGYARACLSLARNQASNGYLFVLPKSASACEIVYDRAYFSLSEYNFRVAGNHSEQVKRGLLSRVSGLHSCARYYLRLDEFCPWTACDPGAYETGAGSDALTFLDGLRFGEIVQCMFNAVGHARLQSTYAYPTPCATTPESGLGSSPGSGRRA